MIFLLNLEGKKEHRTEMRLGTSLLIICLALTSILTSETVGSLSVLPSRDLTSIDKSFMTFVTYANKIHAIAKYPESQRELALSKFLEIHDELLSLYFVADPELDDKTIELLMELLKIQMKKSVLVKPKNFLSKFFG